MEPANLAAWLLERGDDDAPALIAFHGGIDAAVTYRGLRARVARRAATIGAGSIVPIVGENTVELVVAHLATLWAGGVPALVPPVSEASLRAVEQETGAAHVLVPSLHEPINDATPTNPRPRSDDVLSILLYTSGSTSAPKGVMLSGGNVRASTDAIIAMLRLDARERGYLPMPLYYCYGLSVLHTHLRAGAAVVLGSGGNAEQVLDELERTRATSVASVPTFYSTLLRRTTIRARDLSALRYLMVSGGRLHDGDLAALREALPHARPFVRYGVTELTAAASYVPPDALDAKIGSIGRGLPGLPLVVVRGDGTPVSPGGDEEGEVVVRGAHVALGYYGDEVESSRVFRDGAFHSGDRARVDADGYVFLLGRSRDFIKTGGHRVSPQEVEAFLSSLPGVAEVCVYGVPHAARGEALVAAIVMSAPHMSVEGLRASAAASLPPWKVPIRFALLPSLPRLPNGKIDRRAVRAEEK